MRSIMEDFGGVRTAYTALAVAGMTLMGAGAALAQDSGSIVQLEAVVNQAQAVPAAEAVEGAIGRGVVFVDTATDDMTGMNDMSWLIQFKNTSGPLVAAHFHGPAARGEPAGVILDLGAASGLDSPMSGSTRLTPEQTQEVLEGLWYINLHTALNPPGEIRGQLEQVR